LIFRNQRKVKKTGESIVKFAVVCFTTYLSCKLKYFICVHYFQYETAFITVIDSQMQI